MFSDTGTRFWRRHTKRPYCGLYCTVQCTVLLEKLTGSRLVKKFPAFYGTRRFITSFTSVRQMSLSWASSIQSVPSHPTSWRPILILSSHLFLGLPSGLFPSRFPTKTLCKPLLSPMPVLSYISVLLPLTLPSVVDEILMCPSDPAGSPSYRVYRNVCLIQQRSGL